MAAYSSNLQHLQVNLFATHLCTETGLQILAEHLRKPQPNTLYLDATGGVGQKMGKKMVLYYAFVLPGVGKDKPPLPVTECVTNNLKAISWALINSVLMAFNQENISIRKQLCLPTQLHNVTWSPWCLLPHVTSPLLPERSGCAPCTDCLVLTHMWISRSSIQSRQRLTDWYVWNGGEESNQGTTDHERRANKIIDNSFACHYTPVESLMWTPQQHILIVITTHVHYATTSFPLCATRD